MKNIKTFEGFFDRFKKKEQEVQQDTYFDGGDAGTHAPKLMSGGKYKTEEDDIYAIFTKELDERKKNQRHRSYMHDAYHLFANSKEDMDRLKREYPKGGTYKGSEITGVATLNSKHYNFGQ